MRAYEGKGPLGIYIGSCIERYFFMLVFVYRAGYGGHDTSRMVYEPLSASACKRHIPSVDVNGSGFKTLRSGAPGTYAEGSLRHGEKSRRIRREAGLWTGGRNTVRYYYMGGDNRLRIHYRIQRAVSGEAVRSDNYFYTCANGGHIYFSAHPFPCVQESGGGLLFRGDRRVRWNFFAVSSEYSDFAENADMGMVRGFAARGTVRMEQGNPFPIRLF